MAPIEVESSFPRLHNTHQRVHKILSTLLLRLLRIAIMTMFINDPLQKSIKDLAQILTTASRALEIEPLKIWKIVSGMKSRGLLHGLLHDLLKPSVVQGAVLKLPPEHHQANHISRQGYNPHAHIDRVAGFCGPFDRAHQEAELGPSHGLKLTDPETAQELQGTELAHVPPVGPVFREDYVSLLVVKVIRGLVIGPVGEIENVGLEEELSSGR